MLPLIPPIWVQGTKTPFLESNVVEFKEVTVFSGLFRDSSLGKTGLTKFRETIVGFLNAGSGLLIMGVKNDGTIVGVENMTVETTDLLKLWVDSSFNSLIYTDGKPLDPAKVSIKMAIYPVSGKDSNIIVVECINKGKLFNIMTRSGTIVHRLNASNFKVFSEPVYRQRDVKGMIYSMQRQIEQVNAEKKRAIADLREQHEEDIKKAIRDERNGIREYIDNISKSLYIKYKRQWEEEMGLISVVNTVKYILCMPRC